MAIEIPSELDRIKQGGLIDLASYGDGDIDFHDIILTNVLDDILLIEYTDEVSDSSGSAIKRGGIYVPTNAQTKSWRRGIVVLAGENVKICKKGDLVIFPNDKGLSIAGVEVEDYGTIRKGIFLNEQRIFGTCKVKSS